MGTKILKCLAIWVGIIAVFIMICLLLIFGLLSKEKESAGVAKTIPEMKIVLKNTTLDEINGGSKDIKYAGNEMVLVDGDDEYYFDDVEIKGRGNASWLMDKKSYRIRLSERVDLIGLGEVKKWGLISNNVDNSLMRNDLGQFIAGLLYDDYQIHGDFVKLIVDEKNLGLYYITKLASIGKNMIDLKGQLGILAEVDNAYCEEEELYRRSQTMSDCITAKDTVVEENVEEALNIFMGDYNEFEKSISHGDFEVAAERVDMESFAKYFLLSELSSNLDAYVTSWYLYKNDKDDKIYSEIGWDFDGAFGNKDWWGRDEGIYSPIGLMARMKYSVDGWDDTYNNTSRCKLLDETLISPVICYMVAMPKFRDLVNDVYKERLAGKKEEIISYILERADYIRDEAIIDSKLWGKGDFDEEIKYLVWWMEERINYLDELFGGN